MIKLITLASLLAITISCPNDQNNTSATNKTDQKQVDNFLKATIDDVAFYAEDLHYYSMQKIITLAAISKDGKEKIRLYINYTKGPATYTFGDGISTSDHMIYTKTGVDWIASKLKGEGEITFKEDGDYLIGKFSFDGIENEEEKSVKKINAGEFRVLKK